MTEYEKLMKLYHKCKNKASKLYKNKEYSLCKFYKNASLEFKKRALNCKK